MFESRNRLKQEGSVLLGTKIFQSIPTVGHPSAEKLVACPFNLHLKINSRHEYSSDSSFYGLHSVNACGGICTRQQSTKKSSDGFIRKCCLENDGEASFNPRGQQSS